MQPTTQQLASLMKAAVGIAKTRATADEAAALDRFERQIETAAEVAFASAAPAATDHDADLITALQQIAGLPAAGPEIDRKALLAAYDEARNTALHALADLHAKGHDGATAALVELADEAGTKRPSPEAGR